jgi:glycosyltransferase involved in cell wall biosynthesis
VLLAVADAAGGIGRHVGDLVGTLPGRGIRLTVCAPASTLAGLGSAPGAVTLVEVPLGSGRPGGLRAVRAALRREGAGVDVVHAHGLRAAGQCAAFVPGTPIIVTWHNAAQGGRLSRLGHRALRRYVARSTDLSLAASEDLATTARKAGARRVLETFIVAPPLPAAVRDRETMRGELGCGGRPLVLAVGRLQHQKRFDVLIDAAAGWARSRSAPRVVIAGEGPARSELARQVSRTSAPVALLGARDDVADLLEAADVVALPSEWEAKALVAQEALRSGVPLVATAVGGLPSLVGDAAVLVAPGDAKALRIALEAVLGHEERRVQMVTTGLARAAGWPDQQAALDLLVGQYHEIARRRPPA